MYSIDLIDSYLFELKTAQESFPVRDVESAVEILLGMPENSILYVIGNGGSASTAAHMVSDLGVGSLRRRNPIRAISLSENSSVVTAVGNDEDFSSIFSQQILLHGKEQDVLICFSASGNSNNILKAVVAAKELGMTTIGVTGFDGGTLKNVCDLSIHFPTRIGSYGVVEDLHLSLCHILTELVRAS